MSFADELKARVPKSMTANELYEAVCDEVYESIKRRIRSRAEDYGKLNGSCLIPTHLPITTDELEQCVRDKTYDSRIRYNWDRDTSEKYFELKFIKSDKFPYYDAELGKDVYGNEWFDCAEENIASLARRAEADGVKIVIGPTKGYSGELVEIGPSEKGPMLIAVQWEII